MKTLQFSIREITFHLIPEYVTDALYFFTQLNNLCDQFHHFFKFWKEAWNQFIFSMTSDYSEYTN